MKTKRIYIEVPCEERNPPVIEKYYLTDVGRVFFGEQFWWNNDNLEQKVTPTFWCEEKEVQVNEEEHIFICKTAWGANIASGDKISSNVIFFTADEEYLNQMSNELRASTRYLVKLCMI